MNKIYKEQSCLLINSLAFIILKKFYSQNINLFFGINKNEDNLNGHCWLNIYDFNITDEDKSKYEFIFKI
ncbi:MAG TPA: lasso peptide biosynthesis protein [bacterium]|nr:lasso peptide biosynthesis protein [bacterium]HOL47679.1 lasso peptide biosynthesis protein [bacterium]HPQ18703.1 lasso peptide biosynthesis protein [bacterium]